MKTQEASSRTKHKAKSPLVAVCLAFAVLAINIPAQARSTTGWGGFRGHGINCVGESFGAVVNVCNSPIGMQFEMVVDGAGWHDIGIWDSPGGYGEFTCTAYSFSGINDGIYVGTTATFSPSGQEGLKFSTLVLPGWAMSLYCVNVPKGRGISNLNWTP